MKAILLAALSSAAFATGAVAFATAASAQYAEGGARYGVYGAERPTYLQPADADDSGEGIAPGEHYPPPRRGPRDDEDDDWRRPRRAEPEVIERERVVRQPPQIIERERIVRQPPDVIVRERIVREPPQVIVREQPVILRERVYVGAVIPETVVLRPYLGEPRFAGYVYANDAFGRRVIVEPRHRRVVRVVPY